SADEFTSIRQPKFLRGSRKNEACVDLPGAGGARCNTFRRGNLTSQPVPPFSSPMKNANAPGGFGRFWTSRRFKDWINVYDSPCRSAGHTGLAPFAFSL